MATLTTYDDEGIKEDIKPQKAQKPKAFDKKAYWNSKRGQKNKSKKKRR